MKSSSRCVQTRPLDFSGLLRRLGSGLGFAALLAGVAAQLSGCAQSSLIAKNDPRHAESLKRFSAFLDTVSARPGASAQGNTSVTEEKAALIQAEAFYQYRLEFRRPTARSFLAQILASAIEFAPLSIWASSSDITQLRLQSYNGAIQLYEGFLESYPASPYRSLALYRLAWAYRNASIEGLPHDAENILDVLASEPLPASSAYAAYARELKAIAYKSQNAVAGWSVIPGASQCYVGKFALGGLYFGLALGFTAAAFIPPIYMIHERKFDLAATLISFLGFVGLEVAYSDSFEDGQKAAVEYNERREAEFARKHLELP